MEQARVSHVLGASPAAQNGLCLGEVVQEAALVQLLAVGRKLLRVADRVRAERLQEIQRVLRFGALARHSCRCQRAPEQPEATSRRRRCRSGGSSGGAGLHAGSTVGTELERLRRGLQILAELVSAGRAGGSVRSWPDLFVQEANRRMLVLRQLK